jgi:hypothetical protein
MCYVAFEGESDALHVQIVSWKTCHRDAPTGRRTIVAASVSYVVGAQKAHESLRCSTHSKRNGLICKPLRHNIQEY